MLGFKVSGYNYLESCRQFYQIAYIGRVKPMANTATIIPNRQYSSIFSALYERKQYFSKSSHITVRKRVV